jgi:ADP-ribosyl-[dinitrogen reductase] hydrolase
MDTASKFKSSLMAGVIGDALGVPVESSTREELALCAVKNMLGYGRFDQPKGTWSDDSALMLCTMESLCRGYDIEDLGRTFCQWLFDSRWTPSGYVFDVGLTTFMALDSIRNDGVSARESGCSTEDDNGNGSIMRILPAALFFRNEPAVQFLEHIHEISAITHSHPRSCIGCGIYSLVIREISLGKGKNKNELVTAAAETARDYYTSRNNYKDEAAHYERIVSGGQAGLGENDIRSSGYIVDTLEAALWCFLRYETTPEVLLGAVNLGLETDTMGTLAGGIAGLYYGLEGVPGDWIESLSRRQEVEKQIGEFVEAAVKERGGAAGKRDGKRKN